ncbi:MAG: hypothetical protein AAB597_03475 [Patescibacteria group bacterium]
MNKKRSEEKHALRRLKERYGLELTLDDLETMIKRIRQPEHHRHKGKAVFVGKESGARSRFFVWHRDVWFPVIYNKNTGTITTVLPKGAFGLEPWPIQKPIQKVGT